MPEDNGTCPSPLEVTVLMCDWLRAAVAEAQGESTEGRLCVCSLCLPGLGLPHAQPCTGQHLHLLLQ